MKLKITIYLILISLNGICKINSSDYYAIRARLAVGDTTGLYQDLFVSSPSKGFYDFMACGDYLLISGDVKAAHEEYNNAESAEKGPLADSLDALLNSRIGDLYYYTDIYTSALKHFNKASFYYQYNPQNNYQAVMYIHCGIIHSALGSNQDALKSYTAAIEYFRRVGNTKNVVATQNNIGIVWMEMGDLVKAKIYFDSCLTYRMQISDFHGIGQTMNNIGTLMIENESYDSALYYFQQGYDYRIKGDAPLSAIIESQINIGKAYYRLKDLKKAQYWLEKGLAEATEINHLEIMRRALEELKSLYFELGDYKSAYLAQEQHHMTIDSLYGLDKKSQIESMALQSEFDLKLQADSLAAVEILNSEKLMAQEDKKRSTIILWGLSAGLVFLLFFMFQIYRTSRERRRSNEIITEQKNSIDQKQKEIFDSINYARRIQSAILPPQKLLQTKFEDSFILYLPKDIVAGDFYWAENIDAGFLLAVADCTGHGVPGALVSVVCHNALNRSVREFKLNSPEKILDKTRELVIETFDKSEEQVKDGMDIALISLGDQNEKGERELKFSAANNPLYILRNGELKEIKGDKQPVGKFENSFSFTLKSEQLKKNDLVFLLSDGFADQFGGPKAKKLKYQALKEFLIAENKCPMSEIKSKLETFFNNWKGQLEQVDDVCVIGIRL